MSNFKSNVRSAMTGKSVRWWDMFALVFESEGKELEELTDEELLYVKKIADTMNFEAEMSDSYAVTLEEQSNIPSYLIKQEMKTRKLS